MQSTVFAKKELDNMRRVLRVIAYTLLSVSLVAALYLISVDLNYYKKSESKATTRKFPKHSDYINWQSDFKLFDVATDPTATSKDSLSDKQPTPSLTFWSSDLHDSARVDLPSFLRYLNHTVIVNGVDGNKTGPYSEIIKQFIIPRPSHRSELVRTHGNHGDVLSERDIRKNFDFYNDHPLMAFTDAFICTFPASFCEAWMPFNKSIIIAPMRRFATARCAKDKMERLIEHFQMMEKSVSPKHFITAISTYEVEYINYYTGLKPIYLPGTSLFYAGRGVTKYTKSRPEILIGPLYHLYNPIEEELSTALARRGHGAEKKWIFKVAKELYDVYELQDIANHQAVVLWPTSVMSYGMSELYAMEIPMFAPSVDMLVERGVVTDRSLIDQSYCGKPMERRLPARHPKSNHPFSPESDQPSAVSYWLKFSDFYKWPHVSIFKNFDDLINQLEAANLDEIHRNMMKANRERQAELDRKMQEIVRHIDKGRQMPKSYEEALSKLWNKTKLQVY